MALPTIGPAVAFTVADLSTGDDSTIELVSLVGMVTGTFNRVMGGVGVVLDGENVIERRVYSPPTEASGGLIDFYTDPLYWSTSSTEANILGGAYEYYAVVRIKSTSGARDAELRIVRFRFVTDEDASYTLDANGRIPYEQVATEAAVAALATPIAAVLAALKTVDGGGSGLDADLLDGLEASAFLLVSQLLDEDDLVSDSATDAASQQSIKAYVDAAVAGVPGGGDMLAATYDAAAKAEQVLTVGDIGDSVGSEAAVVAAQGDATQALADAAAAQATADAALPSASYTAADVFAKVLTQDGPTTGLNADLLDGVEAATFTAASDAAQTDATQALADAAAAQSTADDHIADAAAAHAASAVAFTPAAGIASTDVQAALEEAVADAAADATSKADAAQAAAEAASDPAGSAAAAEAAAIQRANHTGTQAAATISDFDTEVASNSAVAANTAKATNATHTGHATGATALTLAKAAITDQTVVTAVGTDHVLIADASDSDNLKRALVSDFASAGGDMAAATYDAAAIEEQLVGLTATQTLTNKTLTTPTITSAKVVPTTKTNDGTLDISAESACVWTINTSGQTTTVTGEAAGANYECLVVFANSGADAVTWAGVDVWVGGSEPTMVDGLIVSLFSVGTTVYGAAGLTAAELLTLIKTVDGTGSGLDADTVDGSEASALLDRANHTGTQTASTVSDFDTAVAANSAVAANTAKTTNATHTGDVTGATALTIGADKVTVGMIADARLKAVAGLTMAADKIIYWTGATAAAATDLTTVARTLLGRSTVALMRTDLEVSRFTSGAGAPSSTPTAKGNWYFDTTNNVPYVAVGTASSADWRRSVTRRSATAQSGTTYTLAATDELTTVRCTNSSQVTVTIPTNASVALPVGFRCQLFSTGAGGLTLSTSGITLATGVKKTVAQAQGLYLEKWDTDSWIVVGGTST